MTWETIDIRQWKQSAVQAIAEDWALVTAGTAAGYNTMTVSWGGLGEIWGKDAAFIFIRPQRHTMAFLEANERFTLCFFGGEARQALAYCGSHSGRDVDKAAQTGLTPVFEDDVTYFAQARVVLRCRKMAGYDLTPQGFLDGGIEDNYHGSGYHRMFIAEIEQAQIRRD